MLVPLGVRPGESGRVGGSEETAARLPHTAACHFARDAHTAPAAARTPEPRGHAEPHLPATAPGPTGPADRRPDPATVPDHRAADHRAADHRAADHHVSDDRVSDARGS
ncbi:hypothetical protein GCM10009809_29310 [Isoptericola hypogeus]|uniref:Uncharacterized protein n=1 Tax=Isoptericola hypogeus TaxID=300179 RepID=A0ABP4VMM7_9MICO